MGRPATGDLPDDWRMVAFGDMVQQVKTDADPETSGLERYVAGEHMVTDDLHIRSWGTIGDGYLGPAFHRQFTKGQVLYGSRRTYLRKVAIADFDGICANTTFVLEPKDSQLIPELLPFLMQTHAFNNHAVQQSRGSVNPYVNFRDIAWYTFPLPPKEEQRRIADILWAADAAVERWREVAARADRSLQTFVRSWLAGETARRIEVGAVARFKSGESFPVSSLGPADPFHAIPVHGGNGISGYSDRPMPEVERRTVVVGRVGQSCGTVWLADPPCWVTDNALYASTIADDISVEFLAICLTSLELNRNKLGTYLPLVTQSLVHSRKIPVPSLDRQNELTAIHAAGSRAVESARAQMLVLAKTVAALREHALAPNGRAYDAI